MKVAIIVPCHNEQEVLNETATRLETLLRDLQARHRVAAGSHVLFVDDGSTDATWSIVESLARRSPLFRGLKLSRNCGHQNALLAGLHHARADAAISIDADLQDDLGAIEPMIDAHRRGADIVYGVRRRRDADTPFKRWTAVGYYALLRRFGVEVVSNHADFRLMSRRALDALARVSEANLFLRGIVPLLGFPSATVSYDRGERHAGASKYPLRKMLALAWQGITSFSTTPLRLITVIGFVVSMGSLGLAAWALWVRLFTAEALPGWASVAVPLYFLGGVQLLALGIVGEYIAKIYSETKRRPAYFVEQATGFRDGEAPRELD